MRQGIWIVGLMIGCVALGALCVMTISAKDQEAPVITVEEKKLTYTEGEDYQELLEGVTAKDNRDGNLTEKIFVDSVMPLDGEEEAIVRYGAIDKAGNVGTAKRKVSYHTAEKDKPAVTEQEETKEDATQENDQDGEKAAETSQAGADAQEPLTSNGAVPAMRLTTSAVTLPVGTDFNPLDYVQQVIDDVDDESTLYQHIQVDGDYNTNTSGIYTIRYYVTDSNGNASDGQDFTLTIQ